MSATYIPKGRLVLNAKHAASRRHEERRMEADVEEFLAGVSSLGIDAAEDEAVVVAVNIVPAHIRLFPRGTP